MKLFLLVLVLLFALPRPAAAQADPDPSRFEDDIRAFEQADSLTPPPTAGVLFVGSSSIAGWKSLASDYPNHNVLNRGFGGSEISDVIHFADRIVIPYEPEVIVLYAGDNDIAGGKGAHQVFADYRSFVDTVRAELPETRIVFIAIKPSIAREHLMDEMRTANQFIKFYARQHERLDYVDVFEPMLSSSGSPRKELFIDDGLHMNENGYALWRGLVAPYLKSAAGR